MEPSASYSSDISSGSMHNSATLSDGESSAPSTEELLHNLEHAIEHSGHLLPAQGPITVFVHHNTLHAFEELTFDDAVKKGARIFGCHPYLPEDQYRQRLAQERITVKDLKAVLQADLGERGLDYLIGKTTRFDLRLAMLQFPLRVAPPAELRWFVAETDALRRFREDIPKTARDRFVEKTRHWVMRDLRGGSESGILRKSGSMNRHIHEALAGLFKQFGESSIDNWSEQRWEAFSLQALWRACRAGVHGVKATPLPPPPAVRHRDLLLEASGQDTDRFVNEVLIRFCAAYLDQGLAHWFLPHRDKGFYEAFLAVYSQGWGPPDRWRHSLTRELNRLKEEGLTPLESVLESLNILGVPPQEWESFLTATFLSLRGWGGMVRQIELRADRAVHPIPAGSLVGFLAIRLILERSALESVARETLGFTGPLHLLRQFARNKIQKPEQASVDQRAFLVFQLAQILGWVPEELFRLPKTEWSRLVEQIETFSSLERRRIFQQALERRYRTQTLDALSIHAGKPSSRVQNPKFQAAFCLDEREESFRRHLEEVEPRCETFSAAGFYNVAMYYRGAAEAHYTALCPVIIKPQHWVAEYPTYNFEKTHRRRAQTRRALGAAALQMHIGSRTFTLGALLTTILGGLATIPLVARILFPRLTSRIRKMAALLVGPPPVTELQLERSDSTPGPEENQIGFTVAEMAACGERCLRDIGLTSNFARLVFLVGHGSNSLNNPHNSAYNCGACSGAAGGPNARALARMLNDLRVRDLLAERGLIIPESTVFIGGYHNTCNDSVTYFDLDRLPKTHFQEFEEARQAIEETCDRNAHERCRRFMSAPLNMSFTAARRHVEERSEDLAQTRPECGHATNALCLVGRRQRSRGLFMDRRNFLTSYDPTQDDENYTILTRILQAAVPVCAGINLEYYFSYVDNPGWGCGTKLPHNVSALLGIMDGAASDLRPGLPWQMVEIHEPIRLLFIIETTPQAMNKIMDRNEGIARLCRNGWVQVATLDPNSGEIQLLVKGKFERYQPETTELPSVPSSVDWYRGWRDNLGFAVIESNHEE